MIESSARRLHGAAARPRISFVVAWQGAAAELSRRLRVWDRWVDDGIDVVVVCSCPTADREQIERAHPDVRVVNARADEDLSTLRQLGVSAAQGDIVVIVDDTIGWASSWRDHLPVASAGEGTPATGVWIGSHRAPRMVEDASVR
jgi:hypothetical protein